MQARSGDDKNRCLVEIDPRSVGNEPVGMVQCGSANETASRTERPCMVVSRGLVNKIVQMRRRTSQ